MYEVTCPTYFSARSWVTCPQVVLCLDLRGSARVPTLAEWEPCPPPPPPVDAVIWTPPFSQPWSLGVKFPQAQGLENGGCRLQEHKWNFLPPVERTQHSLAFEIIQEAGCVLFSFLHCLLLKPTCYITPQLCLGKVGFEFVPPVGQW